MGGGGSGSIFEKRRMKGRNNEQKGKIALETGIVIGRKGNQKQPFARFRDKRKRKYSDSR